VRFSRTPSLVQHSTAQHAQHTNTLSTLGNGNAADFCTGLWCSCSQHSILGGLQFQLSILDGWCHPSPNKQSATVSWVLLSPVAVVVHLIRCGVEHINGIVGEVVRVGVRPWQHAHHSAAICFCGVVDGSCSHRANSTQFNPLSQSVRAAGRCAAPGCVPSSNKELGLPCVAAGSRHLLLLTHCVLSVAEWSQGWGAALAPAYFCFQALGAVRWAPGPAVDRHRPGQGVPARCARLQPPAAPPRSAASPCCAGRGILIDDMSLAAALLVCCCPPLPFLMLDTSPQRAQRTIGTYRLKLLLTAVASLDSPAPGILQSFHWGRWPVEPSYSGTFQPTRHSQVAPHPGAACPRPRAGLLTPSFTGELAFHGTAAPSQARTQNRLSAPSSSGPRRPVGSYSRPTQAHNRLAAGLQAGAAALFLAQTPDCLRASLVQYTQGAGRLLPLPFLTCTAPACPDTPLLPASSRPPPAHL